MRKAGSEKPEAHYLGILVSPKQALPCQSCPPIYPRFFGLKRAFGVDFRSVRNQRFLQNPQFWPFFDHLRFPPGQDQRLDLLQECTIPYGHTLGPARLPLHRLLQGGAQEPSNFLQPIGSQSPTQPFQGQQPVAPPRAPDLITWRLLRYEGTVATPKTLRDLPDCGVNKNVTDNNRRRNNRPRQLKEQTMKTRNYLLVAAAAVMTFEVTLSAQAAEPAARSSCLPKNRAVLASPRTLEQFPELLRTKLSSEEFPARVGSKADRLIKLSENRALAASPRFREEHPELLRVSPSKVGSIVQVAHTGSRMTETTENRALVNSPRFLEEHPEILRGTPSFEVAPLK